jgi:ubiquitin carboxyl-terminal hydrolase 14
MLTDDTSMASTIELKLKHAGKTYPVQVDLAAPATTFKAQIEELTGVPAAKQKTVVKGPSMARMRTV